MLADDCKQTASSQRCVPMLRSFRSVRQYQQGGTVSVRRPSFHSVALQFWAIGFDNPTKPQLGIFQTTINTLSNVAWLWGEEEEEEDEDRRGNWSGGNKWGERGRDAWRIAGFLEAIKNSESAVKGITSVEVMTKHQYYINLVSSCMVNSTTSQGYDSA